MSESVNCGWKKGKLGDYGAFKNGINYSRNENGDTEYSILNVRDIVASKYVNVSNFEKVHINKRKATPYLLQKGDIVIVRSASPGESLIVLEEIDNLIYSGFSIRLRCYDEEYSPFIFQFLQNYKKEMDIFSDGTTLKNINQEILKGIEIPLPPLPEQRAIAGVLSSLDDKIDLLHRQNKTLEGMAEVLWRKMFVEEADPGWKKGKLGDYGEFKNGINYSRNENGDAEYSILNVRDIVESKYVNVSDFEKVFINNRKATPYLLEKGDIVIVRSASPGESLIVLETIDNLIYSGFSIRLRCYDKTYSPFLFQFLQSYKKEMDIFSDGTTLKNINQEILNSIELVTPATDTVEGFNDRVFSVYNKILLNQRQIRTLSRLRDTLLPKLMSGKVRVKYFS